MTDGHKRGETQGLSNDQDITPLPELRLENGGVALVNHSERQTIAFLRYHNGSKDLVERIVKSANSYPAMKAALETARNYVDAVVMSTPDKKKRRNYAECLRIIDAALGLEGK